MSKDLLNKRQEFLFLYDIKMGNPNGDPDENRPVLPDGLIMLLMCALSDLRGIS